MKRIGRLGALIAVVAMGITSVVVPADADDTITTQPYWDRYGMDQIREAGFDGAGVKIGILDAAPDLSVPELQGANISVVDLCGASQDAEQTGHGTAVTSLLASSEYGVAPAAEFTVYVTPLHPEQWPKECLNSGKGDPEYLLNEALNDGMDIVVQTTGTDVYVKYAYAVQRAAAMGVPVVVAVKNESSEGDAGDADTNGVIGVGGMDLANDLPGEWSRQTPGLTVMAPGSPFTVRDPDANGNLTVINEEKRGNSFAAPLVAGVLALAKQAYPQANGNQLIHSLIATASNQDHNAARGYGLARPVPLINNDPMQYPETNPLMDKFPPDGENNQNNLSSQEIADYFDGLVTPADIAENDPYVYRGNDSDILVAYRDRSEPGTSPRFATASPSASPSASLESAAPGEGSSDGRSVRLIGGALVFAAVAGAAAIVAARRARGRRRA